MKELDIETLRELLDYNPDTGVLTWKARCVKWFKGGKGSRSWNTRYANTTAGSSDSEGYLLLSVLGKRFKAHRVAWAIHYGEWPKDQIDHEDGVTDNNRIKNLRVVSNQSNSKNRSRQGNNKSGITGVCWDKTNNKWLSHIKISGKFVNLGRFRDKQDAIAARKSAEVRYGFHENHGRTK